MPYSTQSTKHADPRKHLAALHAADRQDPHKHENPDRDQLDTDRRLDKDLEETFPASDAPTTGGVTKIGSDGQETGKPRHHEEKRGS